MISNNVVVMCVGFIIQAACGARGLLQDDNEWHEAMSCASFIEMPTALRELCAYILMYNHPSDPQHLVDTFWRQMAEDVEYQARMAQQRQRQQLRATANATASTTTTSGNNNRMVDDAALRSIVLLMLEDHIRIARPEMTLSDLNIAFSVGDRTSAQQALQVATADDAAAAYTDLSEPREIREERPKSAAERERMAHEADRMYEQLSEAQRAVVDPILQAVETRQPLVVFVKACGGTGKTFCFNTVLNRVRSNGKIALAMAWSGIAALLLVWGRTFSSRCHAPLQIPDEGDVLPISAETGLAKLFRLTDLIVFDEAVMPHKRYIEALHFTLCDLMGVSRDVPFGGKVVVFGGDPRQTCTIIKGASRAQLCKATLPHSIIWPHVHVVHLEENMRVRRALAANAPPAEVQASRAFGEWLLQLGDGTLPRDGGPEEDDDTICLPPELCLRAGSTIDDLIEWVYPNLAEHSTTPTSGDWFAGRCILAVLNKRVDFINNIISERFPNNGEEWECRSADMVADEKFESFINVEVLNTFNPSGFPRHVIRLKRHMPIMLIRNLSAGLCNGTRLSVVDVIDGRVLRAVVTSPGPRHGDVVLLPRITLDIDQVNSRAPFDWKRRQFPIQIAFVVSLNKVQGQSMERVGIDFTDACFAHGQHYTGSSRVGHPTRLRYFVPDVDSDGQFRTRNVVYKEILRSFEG